jgi:hypothetical protein
MQDQNEKLQVLQRLIDAMQELEARKLKPAKTEIEIAASPLSDAEDKAEGPEAPGSFDAEDKAEGEEPKSEMHVEALHADKAPSEMSSASSSTPEEHQMLEKLKEMYSKLH